MAFTYSAASAYTVTGAGTLASPYTVSTAAGNGMYTYSSNDLSFISDQAGTFYYTFSGSFTDGMTTMNVTIGGSSLYYESMSSYSRNGSSIQASATTLLFSLYNMMGANWTFSGSIYFVASSPSPTPTPTPSPTPNTIRIKRSSTTTATPTSLLEGELAANIVDQKLFIGNSSKTPVLISDYKAMGTVTSVGLTVPTGLSVANSPVTASSTLAVTLTSGYSIPTTASQTNWDSAYTQRFQWDGGSTNLVSATGRTSLGATTVGGNLFTLTNPSAITFLQVNANNTVSTLTAASFRSAIGAGTSSTSGTVTSVAALTLGTTGTDLASTVATNTTTPVITLNVPTASATNRGALSSTDWSNFNTAYTNRITSLTTTGSSGAATLTTNTLNIPNYTLAGLGGQASSTNLTSLAGLTYVSASFVKMTAAGTFALDTTAYTANTGTVTSIATTSPITGGTITGTGTIGINAASANTASYVVQRDASGNFSAGTITATLSGNASTATSATSATTATTATNLAGGGAGQLPYNTASGATSFLAAGTTGQVLASNGSSAPSWTSRVNYSSGITAPSSPVVGDQWYDTNNATLLVYVNDGNTSQWVEAGSPSVGSGGIQSNGRLTLESGVPVSSADQTAKTTVYFTPYDGSFISLYNGTSWNTYSFSELSLTTTGLSANSNYDIFAYVSGSTVTLEYSSAWTNDSTRFHALSLLNGVYVKGADTTRRYLGTIRSNASTQFTDSQTNRLVWNFNNRILRSMYGFIYLLNHSYNGGPREYNGGTSVTRMYFITGINGETFSANATAPVTSNGTSCNVLFAIDSTTVQFGACVSDDRPAGFTRRSISSLGQVNQGFHYLTALQSTESAGAATFFDFQASGSLLC